MHRIEVDQSGRIENTRVNSAVAFADGIEAAILILGVDKRVCVKALRRRGRTGKKLYLQLFAAAVFLLLRNHLTVIEEITIDVEYTGHEANIRGMLLGHIRKTFPDFPAAKITFRRIGKKSRAHNKALAVYREKDRRFRRVKAVELMRLLK